MLETVARYALYFFFYSALGWLVESCYCSVRPRKWVNRGFLTGPLCPIYGTGALVFMVLVEPIRHIPMPVTAAGHTVSVTGVAVFLTSLVFADIVEFIVSFLMEKLFHARWWDYSNRFLNIQGRICFLHSMYWGTAGVVFLYLMHPFFDRFIGRLPVKFVYGILAVILVIFLVDVIDAVRKAMDVRKLMDKLKSFGIMLSSFFGNTIDDIVALSMDEMASISEKAASLRDDAAKQYEDIRQSFEKLTDGIKKGGEKYKNRMFNEFPMMRQSAADQLENLEKRIEAVKEKFRQFKK